VLSPNDLTSLMPSRCIIVSITLAIGVSSAAFTWRFPGFVPLPPHGWYGSPPVMHRLWPDRSLRIMPLRQLNRLVSPTASLFWDQFLLLCRDSVGDIGGKSS